MYATSYTDAVQRSKYTPVPLTESAIERRQCLLSRWRRTDITPASTNESAVDYGFKCTLVKLSCERRPGAYSEVSSVLGLQERIACEK